MAVWVLHPEETLSMTTLFLLNSSTPLGQELLPFLQTLPNVRLQLMIAPDLEHEDERVVHSQHNVFLILTPFFDEYASFTPAYAEFLLDYLNGLVAWMQTTIRRLAQHNQSGTFIFFTTNPNVRSFLDYPISPTLDESIHALVKTLSKELHALNFYFYVLCLEPLQCMVSDPMQARSYKKKMAAHAMSKMPLKVDGIQSIIQAVCEGNLSLLSGSVLSIGVGSVLGY